MKNIYKQIIALGLCLILGLGCMSLAAAENREIPAAETDSAALAAEEESNREPVSDTESVYVLTDAAGEVEKIIVSDRSRDADGTEQSQLVEAQQELPVETRFSYRLDGKEISPEELAGKSGAVEIRIDYINHASELREINGKAETLYTPFLMLSALVLDNEHFSNVVIENGKLVSDGTRTLALGYALPGMQESLALPEELELTVPDHVTLRADVTEFSLGSVYTLAATDLFGDYDENDPEAVEKLLSSVQDLSDGMARLLDGAKALNEGLDTLLEKSGALQDGTAALAEGADQLSGGAGSLADGAGKLASGAYALQNGTKQLALGANSLRDGSSDLANGAAKLSAGLGQLSQNSAALNSGAEEVFRSLLSAAETQLKANGLTVPTLTISNYQAELNRVINALDPDAVYAAALAQVTAAVEARRSEIQTLVTQTVREQVSQAVTAAVRETVAQQVRDGAEAQIRAAVEENRPLIEGQVTQTVEARIRAQVILAATGMSLEEYEQAVAAGVIDEAQQAALEAQIEAQMASQEVKDQISAAVEQTIAETIQARLADPETQEGIRQQIESQMASEAVQSLIAQKLEEQMQSKTVLQSIAENTEAQVQKAIADTMAGPEVQAKLQAAGAGAQSVIALKTSLDQYNAFYLGLKSYTAGVDDAARGAKTLSDGAKKLHSGADDLAGGSASLSAGAAKLSDGAKTLSGGAAVLSDGAARLDSGVHALNDSLPALLEGIEQLLDGSSQLREGLETFDEEGIQVITRLVNENGRDLAQRLKALAALGREYRASCTGLPEDMDGELRFIFRSASIG